jgi:hypothetical protein
MGFFQRRVEEANMEDDKKSMPLSPDAIVSIDQDAPLLQLPREVVHQILCYLPCQSLVSMARTCRQMRGLTQNDLLWRDLLRPHIPARDFPLNPYPSSSYRDLYVTHHPYWFLPRQKIWLSDEPNVGRLMICRFDPRRGCIEGYRLLAERTPTAGILWPHRPTVVIHTFNPNVHLWLDDPVLKLAHDAVPFSTRQGWWEAEMKMVVGPSAYSTSASFFLGRDIPEHRQDKRMALWPPRTIPGMPRVRAESVDQYRGSGHKPQTYGEISQTTFRLRQWSQFAAGMAHFGIRVGEEVSTWSTIDPALYTPTSDKPYQGIYVGDYAGHGCEFLLVMQPDEAPTIPANNGNRSYYQGMLEIPSEDEDDEDASEEGTPVTNDPSIGASDEDGPHGAMVAVKLTGDPNIPRGEYTFVTKDIGPKGLIRIATEHPFAGARVVKSRGHIALRGFQHGKHHQYRQEISFLTQN